jgi:hypothetical protein
MTKTTVEKWRSWTLPTKLSLIFAAIASIFAAIAAAPQIKAGWVASVSAIYGPPLLDLPLRQLHAGMLEEIEYNIDCLSSFDALRYGEVTYELCEFKTIFTDSWFNNIAILKVRDYYSESLYTESDWENVKSFLNKIQDVRSKVDFLKIEKKSKITTRDALFLIGYVRYFYKNFYETKLSESCSVQAFEQKLTGNCKEHYERLYGDDQAWQEQIESWSNMPSKYVVDEGKPVERYVEWLSLHD